MISRTTGLVEVVVTIVAMVIGGVFVYFAFQLGSATRPGEMRVWGSTESTPSPSSGSSGAVSTPTVASVAIVSTTVSSPTPARSTTTPTSVAGSGNSGGSSSAGNVAAGKAAFDKSCNGCHPGGAKGVGPALNTADLKQRYPGDSDLAKVIRGGKGIMPGFNSASVSDTDLANIVAYIRSLSG